MSRTYLRGDMYYADLGRGIGSEQEGYRPVVIIQNNKGNKHSPTVIVAAISSKVGVKPKQIRTLDKRRLTKYIGRLTKEHIQGMNHALAVSVDLIYTPFQSLNMGLCSPCADALSLSGTGLEHDTCCNHPTEHGGAINA